MTRKAVARFWAKVVRSVDDDCWVWGGGRFGNGYGCVRLDGKTRLAHRVAYELKHGYIPDGLFVLHSCDRKLCVNHSHLFLGTQADNMADKCAKGRQARGDAVRGSRTKIVLDTLAEKGADF